MSIYGLLIGIAVVIGIELIRRKTQLNNKDILILLISTLIGARLLFLLHNIKEISQGSINIFAIWDGGLAFFGALIGLIIAIYIITQRKKISLLPFLDKVFTYIPLLHALGRIGNYFNKELYGLPTKLPWAIYIPKEKRLEEYTNYSTFHPTFAYEAILNILLFTILIFFSKRIRKDGILFSIYLIGYSVIRILINRIRVDGEYLFGIETSDLLSAIFLIIGITILFLKTKNIKS